ncbi:hypothetical protein [Halomarina litorea]|uniref:hypothetical protein n=1 Tax=Halomarina litorea TaxID=2961595 RepID=UPI0020C283F6|nr:hypothetical protein [Halomarina sp. BCD28]
MSGRDSTTEHDGTPKYPEDHRGSHLLGVDESGAPLYFDAESNTVLTGKVDSGQLLDEWTDRTALGDREVGSYVEEESSTWQSVTEFAKSHLPGMRSEGDDH